MVFHRPGWRLDPTACPSTPRAHGAETYRASPCRHPQVRKNIERPAPFRPPWCGIRIEVPANFDPNGAETISGIIVGFGGSCAQAQAVAVRRPHSCPTGYSARDDNGCAHHTDIWRRESIHSKKIEFTVAREPTRTAATGSEGCSRRHT